MTCECGCERPVKLGRRFVHGHNRGNEAKCAKYEVDGATGCWNWALSLTVDGYGERRVDGRRWYAHRYEYAQVHGDLGPEYDIHHRCNNRRCVNPDHLEALLKDEHASLGGARLTRADAREIRSLYGTGKYLQKEIAERFGCSRVTVSRITTGKIWKSAAQ